MEEQTGMIEMPENGAAVDQDARSGEPQPFVEPTLTRHEPLTNITLFTSGGNVAGAAFF